MREPKRAIGREKHPMPTLDDLIADLNGAKVFCKLDMTQVYHQLEIDEDSRQITTFATHVGLFRYKRLLFGVNVASEIFQNAIATVLHDIPGVRNLSDDIIVFGSNQQEHDTNLKKTSTPARCRSEAQSPEMYLFCARVDVLWTCFWKERDDRRP